MPAVEAVIGSAIDWIVAKMSKVGIARELSY
jgi:hypothetical protein